MLCSNLNWKGRPFRKDIKSVMDTKHMIDRAIERNMIGLIASGNPFIIWHYEKTGDICWCNKDRTPDARHELCYGSGYLNGYQRKGYATKTYASSSTDVTLSNVIVSSIQSPDGTKQVLMLKGGTIGTITTNFVILTNNKEYVFFTPKDNHDVNGSVVYEYSYDDVTWNVIPADMSTLDLSQQQIKFRCTLSRSVSTARLPSVEYFRFRYRNQFTLSQEHVEFKNYVVPAYIASKMPYNMKLDNPAGQGLVLDWPLAFWSIINDATLHAKDVGMFLGGRYDLRRFYCNNIKESVYGEESQLLHVNWETRFVQSGDDVDGIVYKLL